MTQPAPAALRRAAVLAGRAPMTREDWLLLATEGFSPGTAARLQAELGAHLEGAVAEWTAQGHPDPEGAALAEMGDPQTLRRELARTHLTAQEEAAAREREWLAQAEGWSDWTPWRQLVAGFGQWLNTLAILALGTALYRWWGAGADAFAALPLAGAGMALTLALLTNHLAPPRFRPLQLLAALVCCLLLGVPLLAGGLWLVPLVLLVAGAASLTWLGRRSPLAAAISGALGEAVLGLPLLVAYLFTIWGVMWRGDDELVFARFAGLLLGVVVISLWDSRHTLTLARSILQKTLRPPGG